MSKPIDRGLPDPFKRWPLRPDESGEQQKEMTPCCCRGLVPSCRCICHLPENQAKYLHCTDALPSSERETEIIDKLEGRVAEQMESLNNCRAERAELRAEIERLEADRDSVVTELEASVWVISAAGHSVTDECGEHFDDCLRAMVKQIDALKVEVSDACDDARHANLQLTDARGKLAAIVELLNRRPLESTRDELLRDEIEWIERIVKGGNGK